MKINHSFQINSLLQMAVTVTVFKYRNKIGKIVVPPPPPHTLLGELFREGKN